MTDEKLNQAKVLKKQIERLETFLRPKDEVNEYEARELMNKILTHGLKRGLNATIVGESGKRDEEVHDKVDEIVEKFNELKHILEQRFRNL